jgi:hypothetical protein
MSEPLIEERAHALLSPSSAYTWIACKASTAAQIGQPDESSEYADEGTAAHELAKWCLEAGNDTVAYMGRVITVGERQFEVDDEMADAVQVYIDGVRERIAAYELTGATVVMHVEQRLSIEHITGEKNAKGTSDCVLIATWANGEAEICVIDLKYGRGVAVSAEMNYQAMIYAGGARYEHSDFYEFTSIRLVIHQVRVSEKPDEWVLTPAALAVWVNTVAKPAAAQAMLYVESVDFVGLALTDFTPGEKQCRFCKAKAVCPGLAQHVEQTIGREFEAIADEGLFNVDLLTNQNLGIVYESLDLIDSWGKAVRGRIEYELLNGNAVPGVKLVQGRKGHRKWVSPEDSEAMLKSMRLKQEQMYNFKVISPTQAEKLLAEESPRRWKKLEALITQAPGKPSVAPDSDKRPALEITPPADDFEVVTADDGSDLC